MPKRALEAGPSESPKQQYSQANLPPPEDWVIWTMKIAERAAESALLSLLREEKYRSLLQTALVRSARHYAGRSVRAASSLPVLITDKIKSEIEKELSPYEKALDDRMVIVSSAIIQFMDEELNLARSEVRDLEELNENLREELDQYKKSQDSQGIQFSHGEGQEELDQLAERLQATGILRFLPETVAPAMPFVVPVELARSGITRYRYETLLRILDERRPSRQPIETIQVGPYRLLSLRGVRQILDRERDSLERRLSSRGGRPGARWSEATDEHSTWSEVT